MYVKDKQMKYLTANLLGCFDFLSLYFRVILETCPLLFCTAEYTTYKNKTNGPNFFNLTTITLRGLAHIHTSYSFLLHFTDKLRPTDAAELNF